MDRGSNSAVLVTGGAGYIGAHTCKALADRGFTPVAFDNLSSGFREAVRWGPFVHGDIRDARALEETIEHHGIKAAIHLAGLTGVDRSNLKPDIFWDINVTGTATLLSALRAQGVGRLVFSSSAEVYSPAARQAVREDAPKAPGNPYGVTKLAAEWMIEAQCRAYGLSAVALRSVEAAGADPSGLIGEAHEPEIRLIPQAIAAGLGQGEALTICREDFDAPEGASVRDYIHVTDLAAAHVAALEAKLPTGAYEAANIGAGRGVSVREVVEAVGAAICRPVPCSTVARGAGEPVSLVIEPSRAKALLRWTPACSNLERIVIDALRWERHPAYGPSRATHKINAEALPHKAFSA